VEPNDMTNGAWSGTVLQYGAALRVQSLTPTTRVGVVGAGEIVEQVHLPVLRSLEGVEVSWLCDLDVDRARGVGSLFGVPEVLPDLKECRDADVVLVAIPVGARREALAEILSRGMHAFCEKPFAPDLGDHEWIVDRAREHGCRVGTAFMRRFFWGTATARELVASGVLGPVEKIIAGEGVRLYRTGKDAGWYQASAAASGGGVMRETGSHLVDQVFSIFDAGSFVVERSVQRTLDGLEFETHAGGTVTSASGAVARLSVCVSRLRDTFCGIAMRSARGELRIGLEADSPVELRGPDGAVVSRFEAPWPVPRAHLSAIRDEWMTFLRGVAEGGQVTDSDTGLMTTAFIDDCYRLGESPEAATTARAAV
jgi:predicted dehydrogenase